MGWTDQTEISNGYCRVTHAELLHVNWSSEALDVLLKVWLELCEVKSSADCADDCSVAFVSCRHGGRRKRRGATGGACG